jgi:hypothetical protein
MIREWARAPAVRAAFLLFAASLLVLIWAVVRATRGTPIPAAPAATVVAFDAAHRVGPRSVADLQIGIENDLFSPDRTAPQTPYRMPGESTPNDGARAEQQRPAVLGTVVVSDGRNFATMQLGRDSPRLVHVGDQIGDWTVRSITRGKVVIEGREGNRAELGAPNSSGR